LGKGEEKGKIADYPRRPKSLGGLSKKASCPRLLKDVEQSDKRQGRHGCRKQSGTIRKRNIK